MGDGKISFKVDGADYEIDESLKDWAVVGCGGERWLGCIVGGLFDLRLVRFKQEVCLKPGLELSSLAQTVAIVVIERQPKEGMTAMHDGVFAFNKLSMHPVLVRWTSIQQCIEMSKASHAVCLSIVKGAIERAQGNDRRVQPGRPGGILSRQ